MTTNDSWLNGITGTWQTPGNWSTGAIPTATSDVTIAGTGSPTVTIAGTAYAHSLAINFNSLSDLPGNVTLQGTLNLSSDLEIQEGTASGSTRFNVDNGASLQVGGNVDVGSDGELDVSVFGQTTSSTNVAIAGVLDNAGYLNAGQPNTNFSTTITASVLVNTVSIVLFGSSTIAIGSAAPGTLNGTVDLDNSTLTFASGQITTIAGELYISSPTASLDDAGVGGSNSALSGLTAVSGTLALNDASLTLPGQLNVSGQVELDNGALLNIEATAPSILTGVYRIAGDSILEFSGGQITTIAGNVLLDGFGSSIADGAPNAYVNALTNLANITGSLAIDDGATLTVSANLNNAGSLTVITAFTYLGAVFAVDGALTNSGSVSIGIGYAGASFDNPISPQLTVGSFDNTSTGLLIATGAIIGVSGDLQNDGNLSLYAATYQQGAYSGENYNFASVGSNLNVGGALINSATGVMSLGASTAIIGGKLINDGQISVAAVDESFYGDGPGSFSFGSSLNVGGALSNSVTGVLGLQGSTATIGGDLDNGGQINLSAAYDTSSYYDGNEFTTTTTAVEAELTVNGTLDNNGVIEAASGPSLITGVISGTGSLQIEQGASLELSSAVSGDAVQFAPGGGTLVIDDLSSVANGVQQQDFNAAISGFAPDDTIDMSTSGLGNFSAITAVDQGRYDATTGTTILTLLDGQSAVGTLTLSGDYDLESFNLTAGTGLVALQDAGVTTDVAGFEANQAQLDAIPGGFSIIDTAANVAADFPAIAADAHVSAITLTDTAPVLSLTAAELENDARRSPGSPTARCRSRSTTPRLISKP